MPGEGARPPAQCARGRRNPGPGRPRVRRPQPAQQARAIAASGRPAADLVEHEGQHRRRPVAPVGGALPRAAPPRRLRPGERVRRKLAPLPRDAVGPAPPITLVRLGLLPRTTRTLPANVEYHAGAGVLDRLTKLLLRSGGLRGDLDGAAQPREVDRSCLPVEARPGAPGPGRRLPRRSFADGRRPRGDGNLVRPPRESGLVRVEVVLGERAGAPAVRPSAHA